MLPATFKELQEGGSYMIGLERTPFRHKLSISKLEEVGFKNIHLSKAIDGFNDNLEPWIKLFGLEGKLPEDLYTRKGNLACTLSHIRLWHKIVLDDLPYMLIFEDDVLPHPDLQTLGPLWWKETPHDLDMILLGNQTNPEDPRIWQKDLRILQTPSFCLHAYIVTNAGAHRLLQLIKESEKIMMNDQQTCRWMTEERVRYVCWNAAWLPEKGYEVASTYQAVDSLLMTHDAIRVKKRDTGLFYQNYKCGHTLASEMTLYQIINYDDEKV
jgi:GR25 family glycosyltransferase involved in LPS biosynthesis